MDYLSDILDKFTVRAEAVDTAGNALSPPWQQEVRGFFAPLGDFFRWLGSVAAAIADLVMKALAFLFEILMKAAQAIIDVLLAPLKTAYDAWTVQASQVFSRIINIGDTDHQDVVMLTDLVLDGALPGYADAMSFGMIYGIEPLLFALSFIIPGLVVVAGPISKAILPAAEALARVSLSKLTWSLVFVDSLLIGAILGLIIPADSPVWGLTTGIGTSIVSLLVMFMQNVYAKSRNQLGIGGLEKLALFMTIIGMFLTILGAALTSEMGIWITIFGAVLSCLGALIAWLNKDPLEQGLGLLGQLDELVETTVATFDTMQAIQSAKEVWG